MRLLDDVFDLRHGVLFDKDIANQVLFHFGYGGYPAGSFKEQLYRAFAHADTTNFARLGKGFPDEAQAMWLAKFVDGGIETLREYA
jgi:hypothetical protein